MSEASELLVDCLRSAAQRDGLWRPTACKKGSQLLQQGDVVPVFGALLSGVVKLTYLTAEGAEWIKSFVVAPGIFGTPEDSAASPFSARCTEECVIASLPAQWVRRQVEGDEAIATAVARFWQWLAVKKATRESALLCLDAKGRYQSFLAQEPALAARLSQGDIARFLRITPVALSRIKRSLRQVAGPA